jgi:flagellar biosynthesis protein FlhG
MFSSSFNRGILAASSRGSYGLSKGIFENQDEKTQPLPIPRIISAPQFYPDTISNSPSETPLTRALQRPSTSQAGPKLIAVGGGKGGVGKSFLSTNIGISLAQKGYRVALVDLDFGAANLHTCLGVPRPQVDLFDFINNNVDSLEKIGIQTGIENLSLYAGGQEFWQQVKPESSKKIKLISRLQKLDVDYVIMDLAAGTHTATQDFFIFSHLGIVVVVPEPTSIENAYVFLKGVLCRRLETIVKSIRQEEAARELLQSLQEDPKIARPPFLRLQEFAKNNPDVGNRILDLVQKSQVGIIVNQTRTKSDTDIGTSMKLICGRYFGFSAQFLGPTAYDDSVWKAVRARRPLHGEFTDSEALANIRSIANNLANICPPQNHAQNNNAASS